jgi:NAD-dependent deacetylase
MANTLSASKTIDELEQAVRSSEPESLLVVTGAGVSLASGIPTFRGTDPDAVWSKDVTELGTWRYFHEDPVGSWRFYLHRFDRLMGVQPNPAHHAIAGLERWQLGRGGKFLLITQNIDGLHRAAGSNELIEVHGRADRVRCSGLRCANAEPKGSLPRSDFNFEAFRQAPSLLNLPRCPACSELVRPHVLWFDERYDQHRDFQIERALQFAKRASTMIFVGTSFAVGLTDMVLGHGLAKQASMFSIDPSGRSPHRKVGLVLQNAEVALPELVARLEGRPPH